jgi:hypothetical protein
MLFDVLFVRLADLFQSFPYIPREFRKAVDLSRFGRIEAA